MRVAKSDAYSAASGQISMRASGTVLRARYREEDSGRYWE